MNCKKLLILICAVIITLLSVCGCSNSETTPTQATTQHSEATTPAPANSTPVQTQAPAEQEQSTDTQPASDPNTTEAPEVETTTQSTYAEPEIDFSDLE